VAITNEDALGAGSVLATVIRFPAEGVQFSGVTFKLHQSHTRNSHMRLYPRQR
jgi:hypothetical protein